MWYIFVNFSSYSLDSAEVMDYSTVHQKNILNNPGSNASIKRNPSGPCAVAYPLHLAARNGHLDTCQLLIEVGFDVDFVTEQGSALHMAAMYARVPVLEMLLGHGWWFCYFKSFFLESGFVEILHKKIQKRFFLPNFFMKKN